MSRPVATIPEHVAQHIAGGYPEVTFDRLVSVTGELAAGDEVELRHVDEPARGGWGLWDPAEEKVRVLGTDPEGLLDPGLVGARMGAAIERRQQLGLLVADGACRLFHTEGDGIPGLTVDAYGDYLVLAAESTALDRVAVLAVDALRGLVTPQGIIEKPRPRRRQQGQAKPRLHGQVPPRKLLVSEGESRFEVHLLGGANTGLFGDLREERTRLRQIASGRRVLHTFSYAGTLTVALARGGAAHVTLLDLAPGMHDWARRNLELAGIEPTEDRFRFEHVDVLERMATLFAAGERFDLILLDPPTFSAARPSAWSLKRKLPELVRSAARLCPDSGGLLWLATTSRAHRRDTVERMIERGLEGSGRTGTITERRGLPADFPTLECYPRGQYLKVFEIAVGAA